MENKRKEPLKEVSVEIKAFINQQIAKLAPYCLPDSGVSIAIEREFEDGQPSNEVFYVKVTLTGEGTEVESIGKADNVIDASKIATQSLLDHFQGVQLQMLAELEEKERIENEKNENGNDGGEGGVNNSGGNKAIYH